MSARRRSKTVARGLTGLTIALALLTATAYVVAALWYHDDQCLIAEWQCDAGVIGLFAFVVGGIATAVAVVAAAVAWAVYLRRKRGLDRSESS